MIAPLPFEAADPHAREQLALLKREHSMLPNVFRVMANSPAVLDGYVKLNAALRGGGLNARQRELIALRVAALNGCDYCLAAHRIGARFAKLSADDIAAAEAGQADTAADALLLALVSAVVQHQGEVPPELLERARAGGLTDALLLDLTGQVVLNTMTNYINRLARTPVDFGRTARAATEVMVRLGIGTERG